MGGEHLLREGKGRGRQFIEGRRGQSVKGGGRLFIEGRMR